MHPELYDGVAHGDGHCVALVQRACKAPHTSTWKKGEHVLSSTNDLFGCVIATFDDTGCYANSTDGSSHVAIFIERRGGDGIKVLDQWKGRPADYRIIRNKNGTGQACDDASRYYVVE